MKPLYSDIFKPRGLSSLFYENSDSDGLCMESIELFLGYLPPKVKVTLYAKDQKTKNILMAETMGPFIKLWKYKRPIIIDLLFWHRDLLRKLGFSGGKKIWIKMEAID